MVSDNITLVFCAAGPRQSDITLGIHAAEPWGLMTSPWDFLQPNQFQNILPCIPVDLSGVGGCQPGRMS